MTNSWNYDFVDIDQGDGPWFEFVKKINKKLSVDVDDWVFIGEVGKEFVWKDIASTDYAAKEKICQFIVENKLCSKSFEEVLVLMKLHET